MDIGGQDIVSNRPLDYRSSSVIIIFIDKSSQESFIRSEEYLKEAKDNASENTVFVLLGNKSDLQPVVSTDQGHEAAFNFGALYSDVSAKNNENIEYRVLGC